MRLPGFGHDEIVHGFRLCQIHTIIQESPFGKLAGCGGTTAGGNYRLKNGLENEKTAVAMYFQDVFARIGVRFPHYGEQDLIKQFTGDGGDNIPMIKAVALKDWRWFMGVEEQTGDGFRTGTTDADNPDAAGAGRRGDGRYSIFQDDINPSGPAR
jgi:hypothetical protein